MKQELLEVEQSVILYVLDKFIEETESLIKSTNDALSISVLGDTLSAAKSAREKVAE